MDERRYRESRLCRLLGNPVVYQLVILLGAGGPLTPSKLGQVDRTADFDDQHPSGKAAQCRRGSATTRRAKNSLLA